MKFLSVAILVFALVSQEVVFGKQLQAAAILTFLCKVDGVEVLECEIFLSLGFFLFFFFFLWWNCSLGSGGGPLPHHDLSFTCFFLPNWSFKRYGLAFLRKIDAFFKIETPWLTVHSNENSFYVFFFWELLSLSPNFHIHVSVSDLFIPRIGPHTVFSCSKIGRPIMERYKSHRYMSVGTGGQIVIFCFGNNSFISGNT